MTDDNYAVEIRHLTIFAKSGRKFFPENVSAAIQICVNAGSILGLINTSLGSGSAEMGVFIVDSVGGDIIIVQERCF